MSPAQLAFGLLVDRLLTSIFQLPPRWHRTANLILLTALDLTNTHKTPFDDDDDAKVVLLRGYAALWVKALEAWCFRVGANVKNPRSFDGPNTREMIEMSTNMQRWLVRLLLPCFLDAYG